VAAKKKATRSLDKVRLSKKSIIKERNMTQYQITVDEDMVGGLFSQDGAMGQLVEQVVQQILEAQVSDHLQADPYERTGERQGYRNGFKPRSLVTRVGTLELRVPQVREGTFSTELFARFQRSEQAFILSLDMVHATLDQA